MLPEQCDGVGKYSPFLYSFELTISTYRERTEKRESASLLTASCRECSIRRVSARTC